MAAYPSSPGMGSMFSTNTTICRNPKKATAEARTGWLVASTTLLDTASRLAAPRTRLVKGPARATRLAWESFSAARLISTAPPGRPMPPNMMNTTGNTIDSNGWVYLRGSRVR